MIAFNPSPISVAFAKSLSQQRLAQLHRDTVALDRTASGGVRLFKEGKAGIPDEFVDPDPGSIVSDGRVMRMHLGGCADDKAMLMVQGLDGNGLKQIVLVPGEAQAPVVMWRVE